MRYHVIPINDLREHVPSPDCWCRPPPDDEHDVFTHHAMDRREDYETGQQRLN